VKVVEEKSTMNKAHTFPAPSTLMASTLVLLLGLFYATSANAQNAPTIQPLFTFTCSVTTVLHQQVAHCPDGQQPNTLLQSADGNFYGTTLFNGSGKQSFGTVFRITPAGHLTVLHTFIADANGNYPDGGSPTSLLEGDDGFLYGTAQVGGANGMGLVFSLSKTGAFKVVSDTLGSQPTTLTLGTDGNLYGGTFGTNQTGGTVFRLTPGGAYTLLHTFNPTVEGPMMLGMTQASDGNFYGTTVGGEELLTSFFRLTPAGKFTVLQTLHYSQFAVSPPIQAANGNLYFGLTHILERAAAGMGESSLSGDFNDVPFQLSFGDDTRYLTLGSDSNLWGAVVAGLSNLPNGGVVAVSPSGKLVQSVAFDGTNGAGPDAALVQSSDGRFFGVTLQGGSVPEGDVAGGVVFAINAGLAAPKPADVTFNISSGTAGSPVFIQGSHFIGTTAVKFNGVPASFKALNSGNIRAVLPVGATTGPIEITNAGGTTLSTDNFAVE